MVSHNSSIGVIIIFPSFFFSILTDGFQMSRFKITDSCFWVISLCWRSLLHFFISFIIFFSSRISIFFLFMNSVSQLYFLFHPVHVLLSWFHWVVYPYALASLGFLKILLFWILPAIFIFPISLGSVTEKLLYSSDGAQQWLLIFHVSCSLDDVYTFLEHYSFQMY